MKRRIERKWMYERRLDAGVLRIEYKEGVDGFIEFAKTQSVFLNTSTIRCPCKKCRNLKHLDVDTVKLHLYKHGFENDYYEWVCHGEEFPEMLRESDSDIGKIDSDVFKTKSDCARKNRISDLANEDGKIDPGGHLQGSKSTIELEEDVRKRSNGTPSTALDQEDKDGEKKVVGMKAVELKEKVEKGVVPGLGSAAPSETDALHEHVNEYVRLLQEQRAHLDEIRAQLDEMCD